MTAHAPKESFISQWDFAFNMTDTLPDMEEGNGI